MASASSSLLLSVADDTVRVFQSLITILSDFYEASLSSRDGPCLSACMSSMEVVQLTCHELHQKLAVLWPCEKQFVAVLGRTGCGKSTLLNLLLSMMCSSGDRYAEGIKTDTVRAVLRDTARFHGVNARIYPSVIDQVQTEDPSEVLEMLPSEADFGNGHIQDDLLESEHLSVQGLLGICCAQDRPMYMSQHIPHYDTHPFILQNGRMGDAGTTKVTSIEYGPKYVGHIRWMSRKKLRKNLRDLRQVLDNSECVAMDDRSLAELKEFWRCVRQLVNLPSSAERPTEEQINTVINDLGAKRGLLGKEEVIETNTTQGFTIDRVFVREGIKEKLQQQLGKLIEDLSIEVPVSSFEGGITLLDVPGTNDPRVLHQRETRDAIDRTSLILLVLDKSVMDVQTQESLTESILLERMLMDETVRCSLVVVGIAEKDTKRGQSPKDLITGFDPKGNILRTLRKVFQKIASRLCKSKRLKRENALIRIESLFTSSISLIPVLPFLCASLHLSPSNPKLHQTFCQSEDKSQCPLSMSREEIRKGCTETNIPHLLEKVHSVRVPPSKKELLNFMTSTIDGLRLLTQHSTLDDSFVKFLNQERNQAVSVAAEEVSVNSRPVVNTQLLNDLLDQCADECRLEPNDIEEICSSLGEDLLSQLQTGRFSFGPFILRGFCPEVLGQKANNLAHSVDEESKHFTDQAFSYLCSLRGDDARIDAIFEKVENECLALAVGLHDQLYEKWKLSLQRLRAKCFCGGIDGGLLGQVRAGLRKAYYGALKYLSNVLKQGSKSRNFRETLQIVLESNDLRERAGKTAKEEVGKAVDAFWKNLVELVNAELQFLWRSWQDDIKNLAKSALETLRIQKDVAKNPDIGDKMEAGDERLRSFRQVMREKIEELESLKGLLNESFSQTGGVFEYGYGLLQSDTILCAGDTRNCERQVGSFDRVGQASLNTPRQGGESAEGCALSTQMLVENSPCSVNQASKGGTNPNCRRQISITKDDAGQASLNSSRQGGNIVEQFARPTQFLGESLHHSHNHASKEGSHPDCVDANISPRKLLGSGSSAVNSSRLHACIGRSSRKAQVLSEAESHKLQKRENKFSRSRK